MDTALRDVRVETMSSATNTRLSEIHKDRGLGARSVLQRAVLALPGKRDMNKSRLITVGSAAAVLALTAGAASAATTLITSSDIQDGAVHRVDLGDGRQQRPATRPQPANGTDLPGRPLHRRRRRHGRRHGRLRRQRREVAEVRRHRRRRRRSSTPTGTRTSATTTPRGLRLVPRPHGLDHQHPQADRLDGWIVRWGDAAKSTAKVNVWAVCMKRSDDVQVQTTNY